MSNQYDGVHGVTGRCSAYVVETPQDLGNIGILRSYHAEDNLEGMCITHADRLTVESRITALVGEWSAMPALTSMPPACRSVLDAVIRQALNSSAGGKRLRALLALQAYASFGGTEDGREAILDIACALEVFQTAALVHDDIIDDSDLRRGKPSAHRALEHDTGSASQGRGLGLMLGDLLATAGVGIVNRAASRLADSSALTTAFLTMQREVEIGQILDLAVEQAPLDDAEALADASMEVFRWKTASYTTIAPIELALLSAGVETASARRTALAIGEPLGLAFQLQDDLIDVIGSSRTSGKPVGGDIREGKRTVLLADAISWADEPERAELIDIFSAQARDEAQVRRTIELFALTGAVERSRRRIEGLWERTLQAIESCALGESERHALIEACAGFVPGVTRR